MLNRCVVVARVNADDVAENVDVLVQLTAGGDLVLNEISGNGSPMHGTVSRNSDSQSGIRVLVGRVT